MENEYRLSLHSLHPKLLLHNYRRNLPIVIRMKCCQLLQSVAQSSWLPATTINAFRINARAIR